MRPIVLEWLRVVLAALALGVVASLVIDAWADAAATADGSSLEAVPVPSREEVDSVLALLGDGHASLVLADAETADQVTALLGRHATLTLATMRVERLVDEEPIVRAQVDVDTERGDFSIHLDFVRRGRWLIRSIALGLPYPSRSERVLA